MLESKFQFSNPILTDLKYTLYMDFGLELKSGMPIESTVIIDKNQEPSDSALVRLQLRIGAENNEAPFYIDLTIGAIFKWSGNEYDDNAINHLLSKNAPSLLLGYARPIVANITLQSGRPAYHIPFMNFQE